MSSAATSVTTTGFTANWAASTGATAYLLDVSTSSTFASFFAGYSALNVGNVLTYAVTGLSSSTTYYYRVRAVGSAGCNSLNSATQTITTSCGVYTLPYTENFDGVTAPAIPSCSLVQDVNGDGTTWITGTIHPNTSPNSLEYIFNSSNAANDYWFTPGFNLVSGNTYTISFNQRVQNASYPEGLEVRVGTSQSAAGMSSAILYTNTALTNTTYAVRSFTYTATSTGIQYFGWHVISAKNEDVLYVDDISISQVAPTLVISNNGTQIGTQNLTIGSSNDIISTGIITASANPSTISSITFSTQSNATSNYTAGDIATVASGGGFKLFYNNTNSLTGATQLGTSQTAVGAGETITFGSLNLTVPAGTYYFWLTANISSTATANDALIVNGEANTNFTASGSTITGATSTSGTQTIVQPCTTPTNPSSIGSITSTQTTISGTIGGTTATGYVVLFSTTPITPSLTNGTTYIQGAAFNGTTTVGYVNTSANFTSSALISNTNYYIYAFAYNNTSCGNGPAYSGYIQSSIYTCVAPPTGLNATAITSTTATVNWTASPGTITSYTLYVNPGAAGPPWANTYNITSGTSYNLTGLTVGTTYYYQVVANISANNSGCATTTATSSTANFTTVDATLATDYFQSKQTGNWTSITTWLSSHDGSTYIPATAVPTNQSRGITILNTNNGSSNPAVVVTVDGVSTGSNLTLVSTFGSINNYTASLNLNANLSLSGNLSIYGPSTSVTGTNIDSVHVSSGVYLNITGNLVFNGTYVSSGVYRSARLNIVSGGVVNVAGDIDESGVTGGDQIYFTGTGTAGQLNVRGNWNYPQSVPFGQGSPVLSGTGTVTFSGSAPQNINQYASVITFYNLIDSNITSPLLVHGNIGVSNSLKMTGANTLMIPDSIVALNATATAGTISGNGTIEATSYAQGTGAPAASFMAQYKFSTYSLSAMTVDYTANGNQTVNSAVAPYGNLIINGGTTPKLDFGSGIKTLDGSLGTSTVNGVNGYVLIAAGSFNASTSNYNITLGGNWTDNTASVAGSFTPNSGTVYFNNTGTTLLTKQINGTATGQTFNNVSILNATTGTTATSIAGSTGTLYLNGTMTIGSGSSLAAGTASSIYAGGNWTDNTGSAAGGFSAGAGSYTVFFNGKSAQNIGGTATGQTFNNVTTLYPGTGTTSVSVAGSTSTLNVNGTMTIGGSTVLASGSATSINMVAGNWIDNTASGGFTAAASNTVYFKGSSAQTISGNANGQAFNNITTAGTTALSVASNAVTLNLAGTMTIGSGTTFAAGTASGIFVKGNWIDQTTSGGFTPGTGIYTVTFNGLVNTQTISGSATAQVFNNIATTGTNTGVTVGSSTFGNSTITLNINGSTTIGAGTTFTSGSATSINLLGSWTDNTSGATGGFKAGTSNTVYFNGSNTQTITGGGTNSGQTFNNITVQNTGTGSVTVSGTTTTLNLNSLLLTTGSLAAGTATNMNVAGNWQNNISSSAFAAGSGTVTFNGSSTFGSVAQLINGTSSTNFSTLNIQSGTSTTLGVNIGLTGSLTVSTGGTGSIFDMVTYTANGASTGTMRVQGTGTLRLSGTTGGQTGSNFPTGFSSYTLTQSSTTEYYDATTGQTVTPITSYGNLTITGNSVKTAPAPLTIGNSLLINNPATFAAGNFTHTVAANWTNNGTFTAGNGTIIFNGAGAPNVIQGNLTGASKFNYLTFNSNPGGGIWNFSSPADVAADFTLTNGSVTAPSGLLNVAGNWINNAGTANFTGNGGTVSLNGNIAQSITGSQSTTFGTLNINNSAGLKDNLQVATTASTLSFSGAGKGYIDISAFPLTLTTSAAIAGVSSSSFVVTGNGSADGNLIVNSIPTTGFTFPIGIDSTGSVFYYLPATITPAATFGGLNWSAQVFNPVTPTSVYGASPYTGAGLSGIVNAEWIVQPTTTSTATAALTLNWVPQLEGSVFTTYVDSYIGISHYQGAWNSATQSSASHAGHTVTSTFTSFSPFGIGAINNPLPVILVDFNAVLNNNRTVGLTWTTQQEVNTAHFEVERSADGIVWTSIGTVQAVGNSSLPSNYEFTDASPLTTNYYRIKMVNINGAFGYTTERFIKLLQVKEILVFPNPARNYVNVSVTKADVDLNVKLVNQIGQVLQVNQVKAGAGTLLTLDLHNYAQGTYFIQVSGSDGTMQTSKIIIMR